MSDVCGRPQLRQRPVEQDGSAARLWRTSALDEAEYKAVLGGNALQLFPRLALRTAGAKR